MKKFFVLSIIVIATMVLSNCSSTKKIAAAPKSTYSTDMSMLIMKNCVPCHVPAKGGNKRPYDNFASVKKDIDEIIRRIELNPGDRGFMPFKKTAKLNDSTITAFKKWRADGLLEK